MASRWPHFAPSEASSVAAASVPREVGTRGPRAAQRRALDGRKARLFPTVCRGIALSHRQQPVILGERSSSEVASVRG